MVKKSSVVISGIVTFFVSGFGGQKRRIHLVAICGILEASYRSRT